MSHRKANTKWTISPNSRTGKYSPESATVALLQDIRDQLKQLNKNLRRRK